MIKAMELTNFKCFHRQQIAFRPLTLLTGVNSAGKSTVIQALLLLRQNLALYRGGAEWCGLSKLSNAYEEKSLQLAGGLVNLGLPEDILHSNADDDSFEVRIEQDRANFW